MAAREFERQVVKLVLAELGGSVLLTPSWLIRPGKAECGSHWPFMCDLYRSLTGLTLPDVMRSIERRTVDAVIRDRTGKCRILEVDEVQHFNVFRAQLLAEYRPVHRVGFDVRAWIDRSLAKTRLEGGGFAKPMPPLFPGADGRHKQRAFRDALCDVLPPLYGFEPTLRIGKFEAAEWIFSLDAPARMSALLKAKTT